MNLTTLICLPWIVIIMIFFGAAVINITHHDHVFKPKYRNKHGKEVKSNE